MTPLHGRKRTNLHEKDAPAEIGEFLSVCQRWSFSGKRTNLHEKDDHPKSGVVHAVFPSRRGLLPAVRELIDFLAMRFEALKHEMCGALLEQPARDQP